jgi:hypothetical protein
MHRVSAFDPKQHWISDIAAPDELINFGDDKQPAFRGVNNLQSYKVVNQDGTVDYVAFTDTKMFYRDEEKKKSFRYFVRHRIQSEKQKLLNDYYVRAREIFSAANVK